jgi:hypothetical protein
MERFMDPNAALAEIRHLAASIRNSASKSVDRAVAADGERLADMVLALDDWMKRGGFLPADWKHRPTLNERAAAVLHECVEFLDNYVDVVDGEVGEPRPNSAMSLTTEIEEVLAG